jgi:hypothetical protein
MRINRKEIPRENMVMNLISGNKVIIEVILTILSLVSLILFHAQFDQHLFLMLTFMTLAAFYFLSAFFPPETDVLFLGIAAKVVGIASAVSTVGILFSLLAIEGAKNQLVVGMTSLAIGSVILIWGYLRTQKLWIMVLMGRAALILSLSFYYYFHSSVQ